MSVPKDLANLSNDMVLLYSKLRIGHEKVYNNIKRGTKSLPREITSEKVLPFKIYQDILPLRIASILEMFSIRNQIVKRTYMYCKMHKSSRTKSINIQGY